MAGRWFEDGSLHLGLGIEDTFVPQARPGERAIDEYELTEHYGRYREDFALAAGVGATVLRWGVPWYRVAPEPGRWDWDWTDRAVDAQLAAGLRRIRQAQLAIRLALLVLGIDARADAARGPARGRIVAQVRQHFGDQIDDHREVREHQQDEDPVQRPSGAHRRTLSRPSGCTAAAASRPR